MLTKPVHLFDAQTNELTTMDGRIVHAPARLSNPPGRPSLRALVRVWAVSRGHIKAKDEIAYLQM